MPRVLPGKMMGLETQRDIREPPSFSGPVAQSARARRQTLLESFTRDFTFSVSPISFVIEPAQFDSYHCGLLGFATFATFLGHFPAATTT
jgi:hypothetical protein